MKSSLYKSSLKPMTRLPLNFNEGALKVPLLPKDIFNISSLFKLNLLKVNIFLPFTTNNLLTLSEISLQSSLKSLTFLASTTLSISIFSRSRNSRARLQETHPLRKYAQSIFISNFHFFIFKVNTIFTVLLCQI